MRSVLPLSLITVICRVLLFLDFLAGPVAAMGQETSTLPDTPRASQIESGRASLEQYPQQHELSKNHIFWVIPN
jgi:hypothetical protein